MGKTDKAPTLLAAMFSEVFYLPRVLLYQRF